jgi:glycosyltransferase involved in cell wall biosynthesis
VIGPLPHPHNGVTTLTRTILASGLHQSFDIRHLDTSDHRAISTIGRIDVTNVRLAVVSLLRLLATLTTTSVDVVYIPIAKQRLPFLRDAMYLLVARALRRPTVTHFHARGFDEFRNAEPAWIRLVVRFALSTPRTHVIVLGTNLRSEFEGIIPDDQIHVIPNGVSDHLVESGSLEHPEILHLSTLWSAKGVFDVLEAARRSRESLPQARFRLIGDWYLADEKRAALEYIQRHELGDVVTISPGITGAGKAAALSRASVMAFPSRSEGHPLVVLEALSAGLPVVTTRVGAIPEIITDGVEGFLVQPGDTAALTDRIRLLIQDPALRARMSSAARARYLNEFTSEAFVERLEAVWRSVTDRAGLCRDGVRARSDRVSAR